MENKCGNCKYFNCYYTIFHGRLSKSGGHCIHDEVYSHIRKGHFTERVNCEFWEDKSALIAERKNDIIKDIHAIKNRLDDIVKILSLDSE